MSEERVSDEQLWSWIDRGAAELEQHLARHPADLARVEEIRVAIAGAGATGARSLPERIGAYRITGLLGEGGMGTVYAADQETPRRPVALKVIRESRLRGREAAARFRREAQALARLSHPSIATIHEAGATPEGELYIAMERVDGLPLADWLREARPSLRSSLELFEAVCRAVHHAHERGVLHRDLKPSNVLVDRAARPKILDFGLARIVEAESAATIAPTEPGRILGTLQYMSPEQARGVAGAHDFRSDVYALGAMLYEMLAGRAPLDLGRRSLPDAVRAVCEDLPPRPRRFRRALPRDVETIVLTALEKEPARRYPTAEALANDVRRFLEGRPVAARRSTVAYRATRFARRHWAALGAGSLIVALLLWGTYAAIFRTPFLVGITGDWYAELAPFDGLRWRGDVPEVQLEGRWWDLESIDGLHAAFVTGFCKQEAGRLWRKRFSEDLLQVLNRLGRWPLFSVDLLLRDPQTGTLHAREGVTLTSERRRRIWEDRYRWPFEEWDATGGRILVRLDGADRELLAIDGVTPDELLEVAAARGFFPDALHLGELFDLVTERTGRSPGSEVDLELRDLETGETLRITNAPRTAAPRDRSLDFGPLATRPR